MPTTPSEQLAELLARWSDQIRNRQTPETTFVNEELLEALINKPELFIWDKLKFVRGSDMVAVSMPGVSHDRIAQEGRLTTIDDAGELKRVSEDTARLIVTGDSVSLRIGRSNKNRPDTVKVLRKIAPKIKIESLLV